MSKTKLRPCPFCGGEEIEVSSEDGASRSFFRAYCDACSAAGSFSKSRAAAIRAWNDRPGNTINEQVGCLVDIRRVVGDPEGKLMQDELVEKIAGIVEENKSLRREAAKGSMSAPDWEIERLNKKIMLEQAARIRFLAELLEVFKTNKPAEAVRLARKLIEEEMR